MKIGIISDIHSNYVALESVMNEFKKQNVEKMICLGDFIGLGPHSEKCVKHLRKNEKDFLAIIQGNHERYLTEGITRKNHTEVDALPMSEGYVNSAKWNFSKLSDEDIEFIKKLNYVEKIEIAGKNILVEHYSMKDEKKYKNFIAKPSTEELNELYNGKYADIFLFGHTHEKLYIENNGKHYINPGSLGCPENRNTAEAGILIVEKDKIEYTQISVEYNKNRVIEEIEKLQYPNYQNILKKFYT